MRNSASVPTGPRSIEVIAAPAKSRSDAPRPHIAVIEKNALIRECVARCLAQALGHDAVFYSGIEDWLDVTEGTQASLVIVCAWQGDGSHSLAQLAKVARHRVTIMLSNIEDVDHIRMALEQGVRGYILASLPLDVAIEAIRLVEAGGVFVPANSLMADRNSKAQSPFTFTARQAAVAEALRKGKANKRIAHELNMCESTVKVHVRNILKKLNAKNRTEAALIVSGLLGESPRPADVA